MSPPSPGTFRLVTSPAPGRSAAIAVVHLFGDAQRLASALALGRPRVGSVRLRDFGGIDTGVLVCPDPHTLLLMPHAGPAVMRSLLAWLVSRGLQESDTLPASQIYPEAASDLEAEMLATLARAASPLAADLLLDQPRRWAGLGVTSIPHAALLPPGLLNDIRARSAALDRLVVPPTIVAIGPPNVGKSTLLNALAGRAVSIVADQPGTTRDHVGVRLTLAGLVVSYIDTPGLESPSIAPDSPSGPRSADAWIQSEAQRLALHAARSADLILSCGDDLSGFLPLPDSLASAPSIRVCLRADLGCGTESHDVAVSVALAQGLEALVAAITSRLLPDVAINDSGPWQFWQPGPIPTR